jgi:DNA-binding NarL/FixJ family response regulator
MVLKLPDSGYVPLRLGLFLYSRGAVVKKTPKPKMIVAADDSSLAREALCKAFEVEKDYELHAEAVNGEEAIALAKEYKPDLIILDLSMPVLNGIEAARVIKRILPRTPIILLTLYVDAAALQLIGKNVPVDRVVPKSEVSSIVRHVRSLTAA